jgi:diamine N-acetyltransferase
VILIREATLDDYDGLSQVLEEVDALHRQSIPQVYRTPEVWPPRPREAIAAMIRDEDILLLVATDKANVVGVSIAELKSAPSMPVFVPRRYVQVGPLVVKLTHQGQGIGRMLMERTFDWAEGLDVDQIELGVYEFNQGARAFYEKLGFRTRKRTLEMSLVRRVP